MLFSLFLQDESDIYDEAMPQAVSYHVMFYDIMMMSLL